jgi:hypothetical protein
MKSETKIKEPLTSAKLKLIRTIYRKNQETNTPNTEYINIPSKHNSDPILINQSKPRTARPPPQRMESLEVLEEPLKTFQKPLKSKTKISRRRNDDGSKHKSPLEHTGNTLNENIAEIRKRDENEVKRLNMWEKDVLNHDMLNNPQFQKNKKELECINWKNDIRDALGKLNLSSNNFYEDLVKSAEREQGSILFQNINITKKKFQFEIFMGKNEPRGSETKINTENENDDVMNQYKELKQDANYDNIIKTDYYREIIKEKIKLEMSYTKELNTLAQKIFDLKQKKANLSHEMFEIVNYLKDLEKDYEVNIIKVEKDRVSRK